MFLLIISLFSLNVFADENLKIGVSPVVSSAAVFIAYEKGYFKDYGLKNVELVPFRNSGAPMTALLSNGELDIGAGNLNAGLWNAINEGIPLKVVADKGHIGEKSDYIALLVRIDHIDSGKYKGLKDLKGFKMGFTSETGVSQQILLDKILKQANLSIRDVEFVKLSYAEMNIALKNKSIDACIQLEPYVAMALKEKIAKKVETAYKFYPNQQSAAIFFSPKLMTSRREEGIRFMAGYLKGIADYNAAFLDNKNKDQIVTILKKHIKIDNDTVWNEMIPVGLNSTGKLNLDSIKDDLAWYLENKFIKKIPKMEDVYDHKFIDDAQKLIEAKK